MALVATRIVHTFIVNKFDDMVFPGFSAGDEAPDMISKKMITTKEIAGSI